MGGGGDLDVQCVQTRVRPGKGRRRQAERRFTEPAERRFTEPAERRHTEPAGSAAQRALVLSEQQLSCKGIDWGTPRLVPATCQSWSCCPPRASFFAVKGAGGATLGHQHE